MRLYGAESFEKLASHNILKLVPVEDSDESADRLRKLMDGQNVPLREARIVRLDGRVVPVEVVSSLIEYEGKARALTRRRRMTRNKKSILIVDDDQVVCEETADYLKLKGYDVETALTGKEAVEKARNCFFNLAILDIRLPDMDGTALLTKMSETEPKMKKIMLTGYPNVDNVIESLNKQANAYLVKPVEPKKLLKLIEEKLAEQEKELKMDRKKLMTYIESRDKEAD